MAHGGRDMGTDTELDTKFEQIEGQARYSDMGTDTMSGIPIRNVQRETFNSQLLTECPKGRMVGGTWGQTPDF